MLAENVGLLTSEAGSLFVGALILMGITLVYSVIVIWILIWQLGKMVRQVDNTSRLMLVDNAYEKGGIRRASVVNQAARTPGVLTDPPKPKSPEPPEPERPKSGIQIKQGTI